MFQGSVTLGTTATAYGLGSSKSDEASNDGREQTALSRAEV